MELTGNLAGIKGGKIIVGVILSIIGLVFAQVILIDPDSAIVLILMLGVGFVAVKQPIIGLLLILTTTSTIISPRVLPGLSLGGADIELTEVLIVLVTLLLVAKNGIGNSIKRCLSSRLTVPLILFYILIAVSIQYSISTYRDLEFTTILARSRIFFYYFLFFPTLLAVKDEEDLRFFIKGLLIITALVSLYFIYTAVFGQTYLHYILRTGIRFTIRGVDSGSVSDLSMKDARIGDIPGTSLVVTMFFVAICLFVYYRSTMGAIWFGALSALFTIPILLSFTRMTWATTLFMFPVLWLIVRKRTFRLTKLAIFMGSGFLLCFLAFSFHPKYSDIIGVTTERLKSFFEENIETPTAVWRIVEMKAAIDEVEKNPLTGMGVAGEFVRKNVTYKGREFIIYNTSTVHSAFLSLAIKIGIPGLAIFLILYLMAVNRAFGLFRKTGNLFVMGVSIGLFLALVRSFLNAFSQPYFIEVPMIACLAVSFALIEAMKAMRIGSSEELGPVGQDLILSPRGTPKRYN